MAKKDQFDARVEADTAVAECPPFPFTGLDGETYELPHPGMLTIGQELAVKAAEDDAEVFQLLAEIAPDAMKAISEMPTSVTVKLMAAWQAAGVSDEGKSPGPRSVPNRAARRSNPTSRSVASA